MAESSNPQHELQEENLPFEHASQVSFKIEDITFNTNNQVALLYPEHDNKDYFKVVSDFISKYCLRKAFTKSPIQYKSEYVATPTTETIRQWFPSIGYGEAVEAKRTLKKSFIPPKWSQPSATTPVVAEMHKEDPQAAGGPTSVGVTSEDGANPQLIGSNPYVFVDQTQSASKGLEIVLTQPTTGVEDGKNAQEIEENVNKSTDLSSSDDTQKEIKLEDLSKLVKNVQMNFIDINFQDDPILYIDESEEEEAEEIHATKQHDVEDTPTPEPPSPNRIQLQKLTNQLKITELLVKSLTPEFSKILSTHDFSSSLLTEMKGLPCKINDLTGEVKDLSKIVHDLEIELLWDLKEIIDKLEAFTSTFKSLSKHVAELKTLQRAIPKITNCDVLTRKGPIKFKVYREDESSEIILNFKASDLHLGEWREIMEACPKRTGKGWTIIYEQIQTRMDYLYKTEAELRIDINKPLSEQNTLDKLNDLTNKKRKHANDIHGYFRATKRLNSLVWYEDHPARTVLNKPVLGKELREKMSSLPVNVKHIEEFIYLSNEQNRTIEAEASV
nr:hypothetical protein [Tanacetum cinerariifolium]